MEWQAGLAPEKNVFEGSVLQASRTRTWTLEEVLCVLMTTKYGSLQPLLVPDLGACVLEGGTNELDVSDKVLLVTQGE